MIIFLKILLCHILGDFVLQPEKWVEDKETHKIKSSKLYAHIGIHSLLLFLILQFNFKYIGAILLIVISHFLIDIAKIYIQKKHTKRPFFFLDQLLHIIILSLVAYYYSSFTINFDQVFTEKSILLIICILCTTYVSSILVNLIITQWSPEKQENGKEQSLNNAGKYIGFLERLLVFIFIVIGKWEGVGFLLTAKSVFRYGDLTQSKDRKLTEYVLIGTLLSFSLAILTGLVYSYYGK